MRKITKRETNLKAGTIIYHKDCFLEILEYDETHGLYICMTDEDEVYSCTPADLIGDTIEREV